MKFFFNIITLISSFPFLYWAYPYGVQGILEPFHPLFFLYSMHHNQLPKNDDPNIACLIPEIPSEQDVMIDPTTSSLGHLYLTMEDIQYACGHDPCSLHPLIFERFLNYILELEYLCIAFEHHLSKPCSDILSPKLGDSLNYLLNENYFYIPAFNKFSTFIETKVAAMKLQGFNL